MKFVVQNSASMGGRSPERANFRKLWGSACADIEQTPTVGQRILWERPLRHESASSTRWNLSQWHALLASSSLPIVASACFGQSKEACKAAQATSWDAGQPNNSCTKAGSMRPHGRAQSGLRQSAYGGGQVSVEGVLKNGTMPFLPNSPSNLFQAPPSIGHP